MLNTFEFSLVLSTMDREVNDISRQYDHFAGVYQPIINIRWSYGEPPERSHPSQRSQYLTSAEIFQVGRRTHEPMNDAPDAVTASEYTRLLDETSGMREEQNEILATRTLVPQTGVNPFFGENHYIQDLDIQSQFLRPRNSNYEGSERKYPISTTPSQASFYEAASASASTSASASASASRQTSQHIPYQAQDDVNNAF